MKVIKIHNLETIINPNKKPLIAIWGFFDGWHKGHQGLLQALKLHAKQLDYDTLVISFNIKPQAILKNLTMPILFDNATKQAFLVANHIDNYWEIQFNEAIGLNSASDFINWLIANQVKAVVVNQNIKFGHQGLGDINSLKTSQLQVFLFEKMISENKQLISSSYIKNLLTNKQISLANKCLNNFPYTVTGKVIDGIKEARTLGFPTANLALSHNYVIPGTGIYFAKTKVNDKWYESLAVVSQRNNMPLVETYILNFQQDIYGKIIQISFLDFLRDNLHFTSIEALVTQIKDDESKARIYFKKT